MNRPNNVVCFDLELGNDLEPEHLSNINIISLNLEDFNKRFDTDFIIYYNPDGYSFEMSEEDENNELLIWFFEGIGELLSFAYSPTNNNMGDLDLYLNARRKELNYIQNAMMFKSYRTRYFNYAPLGFLEEDAYFYIADNLSNLILDYSRNF